MTTQSTSMIIFGASGDLTHRKLIPGLYALYRKNRLPANFQVFGMARSEWSSAEFRQRMHAALLEFAPDAFQAADWDEFSTCLHYLPGNINDPEAFQRLADALRPAEEHGGNRLYYLATAPNFFAEIVNQLGAADMTDEHNGWRRVIVEKPIGHDLASARALNNALHAILDESQIYRIDHYLAKETVQNILVFRFANAIFEPVWNRNYIDHVQITAAETVDVGHRAGYYDSSGVLRDMFQNHLLQLLTLVAMEPPSSFEADAIRNEKVKVLQSIRPITPANIAAHSVRAQYVGYSTTPEVTPGSQTPTYAAIQLFIDNWRWQGVPFYIRSGKALAGKDTEISIRFQRPPHMMFPMPPDQALRSNWLSICIQPDEGLHLRFETRVPDTEAEMRSVEMDFHFAESFGAGALPEAYERLLLEALQGDASLFTRADSIEQSWKIIDAILAGWDSPAAPPLVTYTPGSWGPAEADTLLARDGRRWMQNCMGHGGSVVQ